MSRLLKQHGPEEFPLIEQVYYPNHKEMVRFFRLLSAQRPPPFPTPQRLCLVSSQQFIKQLRLATFSGRVIFFPVPIWPLGNNCKNIPSTTVEDKVETNVIFNFVFLLLICSNLEEYCTVLQFQTIQKIRVIQSTPIFK